MEPEAAEALPLPTAPARPVGDEPLCGAAGGAGGAVYAEVVQAEVVEAQIVQAEIAESEAMRPESEAATAEEACVTSAAGELEEETDAAEAGKLIADEVREALAARRQQVCKRRLRA